MKRKLLFAIALTTAGFTGCNKADNPHILPVENGDPRGGGTGIAPGGCFPVDCNGMICTMDFREVSVQVQNTAGNPVLIDSFVVTDLAGTPLPPAGGGPVYGYPNAANGVYTVINDGWMQGHRNSSMQVIAKGYYHGSPVFSEPYTVQSDCCHVGKASGKDVIVVP